MSDQDIRRAGRSGPQVVRLPKGGPAAAAGGLEGARFKLLNGSDYDDYLQCCKWDGQTQGDVCWVAKPWFARRTPFDELTRESVAYTYSTHTKRTAVLGTITDIERVRPTFAVGDEILAVRGIEGGTGVYAPSGRLFNGSLYYRSSDTSARIQPDESPEDYASWTLVQVGWTAAEIPTARKRTLMTATWPTSQVMLVSGGSGDAFPASEDLPVPAVVELLAPVEWQAISTHEFAEVLS